MAAAEVTSRGGFKSTGCLSLLRGSRMESLERTVRDGKVMKSKLVLLGAALILGGSVFAPLAFGQGVGYLKANIDPGRAGVFVDGKYLGPATNFGVARKYALSPGEHELKLVDPRFEEF